MATAEFRNGPNLTGWALGAAAGAVAFGVGSVVGGFDLTTAVFIAAIVALVVGVILGLPWGEEASVPSHAATPAAHPAPEAAAAAPVTATAAPVAFVADPVAAPASPVSATDAAATEPLRLSGPRNGTPDDLKEIEGIGPALEKLCHELGFYHFDQIAAWSDADVAWVDQNMARFKGRIVRDRWVAQARLIVSEGLEAFRIRAQTNNY